MMTFLHPVRTSTKSPRGGPAVAIAAALLLASCATSVSRPVSQLVPGQSTVQDVQAAAGTPTEKVAGAGGASTWFYTTGYYGFQTYAVRLDDKGVVRAVEQTLTPLGLSKLQVGRSTKADVLAILGPPRKTTHFPRRGVDAWDYRVIDQEPEVFTAEFSADGVLRGTVAEPDSYHNSSGTDSFCPSC